MEENAGSSARVERAGAEAGASNHSKGVKFYFLHLLPLTEANADDVALGGGAAVGATVSA